MKARTYVTGGLVLLSEVHLPHLDAVEDRQPDIVLGLGGNGASPGFAIVERCRPGEGSPYLRVLRTTAGYVLEHADGVSLDVTEGGRHLGLAFLGPELSADDLEHILLDQLLPLVFAHLGRLSFHGSAVSLDGRALCFLADSKTGKSTLAAALATHAGAHFLADDEVVLEDTPAGFLAHPSYPSVRLWNESARALFDAAAKDRGKHRFELDAPRVAAPVAALVLLEPGREAQRDVIEVEALTPRDAVVGVAAHVDRLDPTDRASLRRELEALARLAERTTIVRMRVARDLYRLPEAARRLREWAAGIRSAGAI